MNPLKREWREGAGVRWLLATALFAFAWAVARAHVQAITGDEGVTFEFYVLRYDPMQWYPSNNNHVLNSLLMRLITSVFGVWHLTVRAPALIGAAIYIGAALWLSVLIGSKGFTRLVLFVCLVYNPFVFDFMVAARGYGMAAAFLLCAIAGPVWRHLNPEITDARSMVRVCAFSSAFLALSFTASFPFAFVVAVSGLALVVWALHAAPASRWKILTACLVPGLIVILLLPSDTLLRWPPGELYDGGTSIVETVESVAQASLYQPNRHILNPLVLPAVVRIKRLLIPGLVGLVLLQALLIWRARKKLDQRTRRLFQLGVTMGAIAVVSLLLHWASLSLFGLLLPRHRTALFLVPLCTLAAGMLLAIQLPSRSGRVCRGALAGGLSILAVYFVICLRLTYFKEWQYQEDVKRAYDVVAWYNHNRGVRDVEVSWAYHGAISFYRDMSGRETLLPIGIHDPHPNDKDLYVLIGDEEGEFIAANQLKVVYRGPTTPVVVAVPPRFAAPADAPSSLAVIP